MMLTRQDAAGHERHLMAGCRLRGRPQRQVGRWAEAPRDDPSGTRLGAAPARCRQIRTGSEGSATISSPNLPCVRQSHGPPQRQTRRQCRRGVLGLHRLSSVQRNSGDRLNLPWGQPCPDLHPALAAPQLVCKKPMLRRSIRQPLFRVRQTLFQPHNICSVGIRSVGPSPGKRAHF